MRSEGGQDGRQWRTNNEKKSPTNIFFSLFSNPQLDLVLGGEFELPVKTEGAEPRELGVGRKGEGGNFVQVSSFDEWAGSAGSPASGRPPLLSAALALWERSLGLGVTLDGRLCSGLPGQSPLWSVSSSSSSYTPWNFLELDSLGNSPGDIRGGITTL